MYVCKNNKKKITAIVNEAFFYVLLHASLSDKSRY